MSAPAVPLSASTPASPPIAGLWRRFGAFVHELLFLVAYLFIVGLIFASLSGESMSAGRPQVLTGPVAVFQQVYLFLSIGAYFIYFWIDGRRTLAFKTGHCGCCRRRQHRHPQARSSSAISPRGSGRRWGSACSC